MNYEHIAEVKYQYLCSNLSLLQQLIVQIVESSSRAINVGNYRVLSWSPSLSTIRAAVTEFTKDKVEADIRAMIQ